MGEARVAGGEVGGPCLVRARRDQLEACYAAGLDRDPWMYGEVTLAFSIRAGGRVAKVAVERTTSSVSAGVADCFAAAARDWRFPKPSTGGTLAVAYSFQLRPK